MEYEYQGDCIPGNYYAVAKALNEGGYLHGWELVSAEISGQYTLVLLKRPKS